MSLAFTPQQSQPIDELIGFLKQGDNYTQDTRNWPDPTEPRAAKPPEPKGCTCEQGQKLDCPIHGMHADPNLVELDHTWSMPQAQPIGYQQDTPRNWTQAISSVISSHPREDNPRVYIEDTNNQANRDQLELQTSLSTNDHLSDGQSPGRFQARDRLQKRRSGLFGSEVGDGPQFSSFGVTNRQNQTVKGSGNVNNMESDFIPFGFLKSGGPIFERLENHSDGADDIGKHSSRFGSHRSLFTFQQPVVIKPEKSDGIWDKRSDTKADANGPKHDANVNVEKMQNNTRPSKNVSAPEQPSLHQPSVTRVASKAIKLKPFKQGKYGKGIISEDGNTILTWRIKGGWNGRPHHDEMKMALQLEQDDVAFHIHQDGMFYFHSQDADFDAPNNPKYLAKCIEAEYPELRWGKISVEEYECQHGISE